MPAVSQTGQLTVIGHLPARPRYASIKRTTGRDEPPVKAPSPTRCAGARAKQVVGAAPITLLCARLACHAARPRPDRHAGGHRPGSIVTVAWAVA